MLLAVVLLLSSAGLISAQTFTNVADVLALSLEQLAKMPPVRLRGMDLYAKEHLPVDHFKRIKKYINGDINSTLLRTVNGLTIILKHDTDLPRP